MICNSKQMADDDEGVPLRIQSWFHSEERKSLAHRGFAVWGLPHAECQWERGARVREGKGK